MRFVSTQLWLSRSKPRVWRGVALRSGMAAATARQFICSLEIHSESPRVGSATPLLLPPRPPLRGPGKRGHVYAIPQPGRETVRNTGRGAVAWGGGPRKLVLNLAQESRAAGRRGAALYAENKHDWRYQFGQSQSGIADSACCLSLPSLYKFPRGRGSWSSIAANTHDRPFTQKYT